MQKHTKIYMNHFGYTLADFIHCEICGGQAVDIHHLIFKKIGGNKKLDFIENLVSLCRECHNKCHNNKAFNEEVRSIHLDNL